MLDTETLDDDEELCSLCDECVELLLWVFSDELEDWFDTELEERLDTELSVLFEVSELFGTSEFSETVWEEVVEELDISETVEWLSECISE